MAQPTPGRDPNADQARDGEALFAVAVEAAPAALLVVDGSGQIALVNALCERVFGYTRAELIGQSVELLLPERARGRHVTLRGDYAAQPLQRTMGSGRDLSGRRKDGTEFPLEIALSPIDYRGNASVIVTAVDISVRKAAEQALRERETALARSNADLEQFAYVVSHDLQEPLRMVTSYLDLLERRYAEALDEKARKYIAYAADGGRRMRQMIDGLLSYARLDHPSDAEQRAVDLNELMVEVQQNLQLVIDETHATVTTSTLPAVQGSRQQLLHLLQNLVGNALKFRGNAPPVVTIDAEQRGDDVLLRVEDNGIGIAPHNRERVFAIFARLHERGAYPGNGIGLALVRKIAERHGGKVWIEDGAQGGTRFCVQLRA